MKTLPNGMFIGNEQVGERKRWIQSTALAYSRSYPFSVFPVHSLLNGLCTCGNPQCTRPGKHPKNKNGLLGATKDEEQIERWFANGPNIGLSVGPGHVVLDVDVRKNGQYTFIQLQRKYEALPITLTCRTGGGGWHYYFRTDTPIKNDSLGKVLGEGIDVRGDGGYVIAPPSCHETGSLYYWDESKGNSISMAPAWLIELLTKEKDLAELGPRPDFIVEGARNEALTRMAGAMRRQGMDQNSILAALMKENTMRLRPPLEKSEVARIATSISKYKPKVEITDWRKLLKRDSNGVFKANASNAAIMMTMAEEWKGVLGYDEFHEDIVWRNRPPEGMFRPDAKTKFHDDDTLYVQSWLATKFGPSFTTDNIYTAVRTVARKSKFNSLIESLDALEWDGVKRARDWLPRYCGTKDNLVTRKIGWWWILSAIARAYEPGCQVDHVLVLEGPKGIGKTAACRILGGAFFAEGLPQINHQYIGMMMAGKWIIELGELSSIQGVKWAKVKQFITQKSDVYREPYSRTSTTRLRSCVFIATTNDVEYADEQDRRILPVTCSNINLTKLAEDRDQLLAETVQAFRNGEKWYPHAEEDNSELIKEQERRRISDPWEDKILGYLVGAGNRPIVTRTLLEFIGVPVAQQERKHQMRIGKIMRSLGWAPIRVEVGKARLRGWEPLPYWLTNLKKLLD